MFCIICIHGSMMFCIICIYGLLVNTNRGLTVVVSANMDSLHVYIYTCEFVVYKCSKQPCYIIHWVDRNALM